MAHLNGWSNADKILGKQNCDTFDKITAASAMIVEKLTLGLVSAENLVDFGNWIVKDRKAEAARKIAAEKQKKLAEQQALELMKGQEITQQTNKSLVNLMNSKKTDQTISGAFNKLKKSGELSEADVNKITDQHIKIRR